MRFWNPLLVLRGQLVVWMWVNVLALVVIGRRGIVINRCRCLRWWGNGTNLGFS
jgi:hypothetical protein